MREYVRLAPRLYFSHSQHISRRSQFNNKTHIKTIVPNNMYSVTPDADYPDDKFNEIQVDVSRDNTCTHLNVLYNQYMYIMIYNCTCNRDVGCCFIAVRIRNIVILPGAHTVKKHERIEIRTSYYKMQRHRNLHFIGIHTDIQIRIHTKYNNQRFGV